MRRISRGTPGGEQEARLADGDGKAAGRADRIVDELGIGRQHRLLAVVGGHHAAAPRVGLRHARHPVLVQHQVDTAGLGRQLLAEIVDGGSQPAVHDHRVGALARLPEGGEKRRAVVAHGGAPVDVEPHFAQAAGHVAVVGVDRLAGQDLVAGAQDFDAHWGPPPPLWQERRGLVSPPRLSRLAGARSLRRTRDNKDRDALGFRRKPGIFARHDPIAAV
jgi:hypothetical protein